MTDSGEQLCDDCTSCSSMSAPFVEEFDDLRLGAEAVMFHKNGNNTEAKKIPVEDFVILKKKRDDGCASLGQTFSTITSISELLDAREGNPDDLLFSLGFDSFEEEKLHCSVLSRFHLSHDQDTGFRCENGCNSYMLASNIEVTDTPNSIVKTQEWLDNQQHGNNSRSLQREDYGGFKSVGLCQGKRLIAQKKRSRWSKSQQSSFDLLPNLEEEQSSINDKPGFGLVQPNEKNVPLVHEDSQDGISLDIANKATVIYPPDHLFDVENNRCRFMSTNSEENCMSK